MTGKPQFPLDPVATAAIEAALSPARLSTFLGAAGGDLARALRLHAWNTALRAAFLGPLEYLEVALRNALNRELAHRYGAGWLHCASFLPMRGQQSISDVRDELVLEGRPCSADNIVPRLSFGFWVSLLQRRMETALWRPCLYRAFAHARLSRSQVHQPLDHLRTFRNRIAHHEPIFHRHLLADYHSILRVLGWICPNTRDWVAHHSRVEAQLGLQPGDACTSF